MIKKDYEKMRTEQIKNMKGNRLLLHSCCAPCSSGVIDRLINDFEITIYFYNPNMDSKEEYDKRANEQVRFINEKYGDKVKVIIADYENERYLNFIKGEESAPEGGKRCEKCFFLRFKKCAEFASENGFDFLTTTLTVSPYKNATLINELGENICNNTNNLKWLYCDFKKDNGYLLSINNSKIYGLYRQDYCGCVFSFEEAQKRKSASIG